MGIGVPPYSEFLEDWNQTQRSSRCADEPIPGNGGTPAPVNLDRTLRVGVNSTIKMLPTVVERKGKLLGFDENGDPIAVTQGDGGGIDPELEGRVEDLEDKYELVKDGYIGSLKRPPGNTPLIASEGQTTFAVAGGYTGRQGFVFLNGVQVAPPLINLSSGVNIVFTEPLNQGDEVDYMFFAEFAVATSPGLDEYKATMAGPYGTRSLGYKPDLPGSVTVPLATIMDRQIQVVSFEADPTGTKNSLVGFNRAILAAAMRGGGTVCAGPGIFKITGGSVLLPSNVHLDLVGSVLDGDGANILICAGHYVPGAGLIDISTEYGSSVGGTVGQGEGINFVMNAKIYGGNLRNAAVGIRAHRFNYGTFVQNTVFEASLTNSWISSHSWGCEWHQNTVYAPCIMKDFVDWTSVHHNSFEGPGVQFNKSAMTVTTGGFGGSYSLLIQNNGFHHWTFCVSVNCEADNLQFNMANHVENCMYGVVGDASNKSGFILSGNWMKANLLSGEGGVIPFVFPNLRDSIIGPNKFSTDGVSGYAAYFVGNTNDVFGNTFLIPYHPTGGWELVKYQVNDANRMIMQGGSNASSLAQPYEEVISGSSGYTIETYKRKYNRVSGQIPFCNWNRSSTTMFVDTFIDCDAYGTMQTALFNFVISSASATYMCSGYVSGFDVLTITSKERFSGNPGPTITAVANGSKLRLMIPNIAIDAVINGFVKEQ